MKRFYKLLFVLACLFGFSNAYAQFSNYRIATVDGGAVKDFLTERMNAEEVSGLGAGFSESDDIMYSAHVGELQSNFMIIKNDAYNARTNIGASNGMGADRTAKLNQNFKTYLGGQPILLENNIQNAYVKYYYYNNILIIEQETGPTTTIKLNTDKLSIRVGDTATLTATVEPEAPVTWSSNAKSVATVDENGVVTAVGVGFAIISAEANGAKTSCGVTVDVALAATFMENLPQTAADAAGWTTSDESDVEFVEEEKALSFSPFKNSFLYSPRYDVPAAGNIYFSFKLNREDASDEDVVYEVYIGTSKENLTQQMEGDYLPAAVRTAAPATLENGTNVMAFLQAEGKYLIGIKFLEGVGAGNYSISNATLKWEKSDVPAVTVKLDKATLDLQTGEEATIVATVIPSEYAQYLRWSSSDESVAAVSGGKVVAVAPGTATITAKYDDETYATCEVTVVDPPLSITLNQTEATLDAGKTLTLKATVIPDKDAVVTWTSSDEKVATVEDGVVTGVAEGVANITASYKEVSAICEVTVHGDGAVSTIFTEGAVFDVYTVEGVLVLRGADFEAFRALGAGLYVVNGQKVLVK